MEHHHFALTNDPVELERLQEQMQTILQANGLRLRVISPINVAVRALLMAHKAVTAHGGKMAFLSCRPGVREVLRICGLEQLAPNAESIEAARRWVQ